MLLLILFAVTVQAADLNPNAPLRGELAATQSHIHNLAGAGDQYLHLVVRQQGGDVRLVVQSPEAALIAQTVRDAVAGSKEIFAVLPAAGAYAAVVESTATATVSYELEVRLLRPATAEDRRRAAAFALSAEGAALATRKPRTGEAMRQGMSKLREALPLWESLGDAGWRAYTLHELGSAHFNLDELPQARDALLAALPARRTANNPRELALTLSTLGAAYNGLGKFREAIAVLEEALPLRRIAGDRIGEANTLNNIGFALNRLGQRERAVDHYVQALQIRRTIDDKPGLAIALGNLAALHRAMGQLDKALTLSAEQLTLARAIGSEIDQADALSGLGTAHYTLGDVQQAQAYWQQAEPLYVRTGDNFGLGSVYSSLGAAHASLRQFPEAVAVYTRSLELRRKSGNALGQISSLLGLCMVHRGAGDAVRAAQAGQEALAIARKAENPAGIGRSLRCLGLSDLQAGRTDGARQKLEESAGLLKNSGDLDDLSLTLAALAETEAAAGKTREALASVNDAIRLADAERTGLTPDLRAMLRGARQREYALQVELLMRLHGAEPAAGFDTRAFEAAERSRARSLIEMLNEAGASLTQSLTPEQRERGDRLHGHLSALQRSLFQGSPADGRTKQLEQQLADAERELERHQMDLRQSAGRYAEVRYAEPMTVSRLHEVLEPGTVLVAYAIGEERSFVWAVGSERNLLTGTLPGRAALEKAVAAYRQQLSQRVSALTLASSLGRMETASRGLYEMLLGPVAPAAASARRLIIVPDGPLAYLPFETLTARSAPLIETHAIAYAPSVTVLAALRSQPPRRAERSLLAIADPVYPSASTTLAGYTAARGLNLINLPNTRAEAAAISGLFEKRSTLVHTGAAATERAVKSQSGQSYQYIHIAAHGYFDEEHPQRSGILLAPGDGEQDDGILQVREIAGLRLNADLVTLSACQTGLGRVVAGEGVLGLTRAFLYAGVRSVAVSLWNVNDAATAELMKAFYRNLSQGMAKPEALRMAKLNLIRGARKTWRHPYFWAPFVLW
ncbi:MAG: CHAT domain-containing protein [Bryobacterales bacterium]|nr:CHAT domain-containing protein [Bryobacterales bacterium]